MKIRIGLIIFFLGCLILLCGCSGTSGGGGGGVGNLYGTVVDLSSSPISNADVTIDTSNTKTLSNGTYSFINLPSGDKTIYVIATAKTPSYRKVSFAGGTTAYAGISILANLDSKVTPITRASGGTATNTTGSIKMVFPPNSVTGDTANIVLTSVPKIAAPYNPPEGDQFVSYIVYAKPDTMTLEASAKLSVPNQTNVPATFEVSFYKFNTATMAWELLPGHGHSTTETNTIDFYTDQMGWIAAIMLITPAPGWIQGTVTSLGSPVSGVNVWTMTSYAITDSSGTYRLNYIPEGTAEVYASALGYSLYGPQPATVSSNAPTTHNIDLSGYVISQGSISGRVRDFYDGTLLYQAKVVESNGGVAYTDEYGRYTLYNVPTLNPTDVTAYADNHVSSKEAGVIVPPGGTVTDVNFDLIYVGAAATYEFTFETTTEGFRTYADEDGHNFWHRQSSSEALMNYFNSTHEAVTRKVYLKGDGRIPNAHNGIYYFWYGQASPATVEASYIGNQDPDDITTTESGTGGFSSVTPHNLNSGTLESPALDLKGYTYGKLSFWTWWEIEGFNPTQGYGFDTMTVWVSKSKDNNDYTTWDQIGYLNPFEDPAKTRKVSGEAYTSGGFDQPGMWVQHSYDLTPYIGNFIKIRFWFTTGDRQYNGFRGWFLDDIKVENSQFGTFSLGSKVITPPPSFPIRPRN